MFSGDVIAMVKDGSIKLTQCVDCRRFWVSRLIDSLGGEEVNSLQRILDDWNPNLSELVEIGVDVSHTVCTPCIRNRKSSEIHAKQEKEGFSTCYATANDGRCSQDGSNGKPRCRYYGLCVVTQEELVIWEQRTEHGISIQTT